MTLPFKRDLVKWFVKNILLPQVVRIDSPGFIVTVKNAQGAQISQRNVLLSETQLAEFEKGLVKKFGEEGKKIAYSIGKNHGNAYCNSFEIPRLKEGGEKTVDNFIPFFMSFMGATWGNFPEYDYDLKKKIVKFGMADHIVCRKNGLGYMLGAGVLAGGWAWIVHDTSVEGVQTQCTGRGDKECRLICAPADYLKKQGLAPFIFKADAAFQMSGTYNEMNAIRKPEYSRASLKSMIESNIFKFERNKLSFHGERYFQAGIELLYLIELTAAEKKGVKELLFSTAFEQGKKIAESEKGNDYSVFIPDFISATGFGEVLITGKAGEFAVQVNYFPWLTPYDKITYSYYKGLLSGLLTGFSGKVSKLTEHAIDVSGGQLKLSIW
ncbi:MAG TPA: hypothetical protein VJH23_05855 [archaeon]|nr:hypothetical protein [archaeon]